MSVEPIWQFMVMLTNQEVYMLLQILLLNLITLSNYGRRIVSLGKMVWQGIFKFRLKVPSYIKRFYLESALIGEMLTVYDCHIWLYNPDCFSQRDKQINLVCLTVFSWVSAQILRPKFYTSIPNSMFKKTEKTRKHNEFRTNLWHGSWHASSE